MEYIARIWLDLKIQAKDDTEAKRIANQHPIEVKENPIVEVYDSQVAWVKVRKKE